MWKSTAPRNSKLLRSFGLAKPSQARFNQLSRTRFFKTPCSVESLCVARAMLDARSRFIGVGRFLLLRTDVLCRCIECNAHNCRRCDGKINIRVTLPAPGATGGFENLGGLFNEC